MINRAVQCVTFVVVVSFGLVQHFAPFLGEITSIESFSYLGFIDFKCGYFMFAYDIPNPYYQPRELLYVYH